MRLELLTAKLLKLMFFVHCLYARLRRKNVTMVALPDKTIMFKYTVIFGVNYSLPFV